MHDSLVEGDQPVGTDVDREEDPSVNRKRLVVNQPSVCDRVRLRRRSLKSRRGYATPLELQHRRLRLSLARSALPLVLICNQVYPWVPMLP